MRCLYESIYDDARIEKFEIGTIYILKDIMIHLTSNTTRIHWIKIIIAIFQNDIEYVKFSISFVYRIQL